MESKNSVNKREDSCSYGLSLTGELQQGKEFARQLQMMLHNDADAQPHQVRVYLVQQIIASFDRAVSIAHQTEPLAPSPPPPPLLTAKSDSPSSGGATSPRSEDSDPVGDLQDSRTRKKAGQPQWTTKVQVSPETGFEGPPPDGYNWRKYGQKEILRADYPRAYYRCALKNQTRCPATKHVQRCDEDPSTFEVTYKGFHTCNHPTTPSTSHPNPNPRSGPGKETLISFNPPNNPQCFTLQNQQQQLPPHNPNQANYNHGFQFHATSSGPTAATSAAMPAAVRAASSASATSSPVDIGGDFPFDQLDFDALEFFH